MAQDPGYFRKPPICRFANIKPFMVFDAPRSISRTALSATLHTVRIALNALPHDRLSNWQINLSKATWTSLVSASCTPDEGYGEFLYATCMILLDRFENPEHGSEFDWEWDAFSDLYRSAPAKIRAAIMNSLRNAQNCDLVHPDISIDAQDCLTNKREEVVAPLLTLAQSLTPKERIEIAKADYGYEVDIFLAALNDLLASDDCRFRDSWYPAEVVELVSHVPGTIGFEGCTALVLANAIYDGDGVGNASFRWEGLGSTYQDLRLEVRTPFLRAFRHLYEEVPDWAPFWGTRKSGRMTRDQLIPWQSVPSSGLRKAPATLS